MFVGLNRAELHAGELGLKLSEHGSKAHREGVVVGGDAHDLLEERGLHLLVERERLDLAHHALHAVVAPRGRGRCLHQQP